MQEQENRGFGILDSTQTIVVDPDSAVRIGAVLIIAAVAVGFIIRQIVR